MLESLRVCPTAAWILYKQLNLERPVLKITVGVAVGIGNRQQVNNVQAQQTFIHLRNSLKTLSKELFLYTPKGPSH